ncbi:hypothetical protein PG987_015931 [Apiospora arundinis]
MSAYRDIGKPVVAAADIEAQGDWDGRNECYKMMDEKVIVGREDDGYGCHRPKPATATPDTLVHHWGREQEEREKRRESRWSRKRCAV